MKSGWTRLRTKRSDTVNGRRTRTATITAIATYNDNNNGNNNNNETQNETNTNTKQKTQNIKHTPTTYHVNITPHPIKSNQKKFKTTINTTPSYSYKSHLS